MQLRKTGLTSAAVRLLRAMSVFCSKNVACASRQFATSLSPGKAIGASVYRFQPLTVINFIACQASQVSRSAQFVQ